MTLSSNELLTKVKDYSNWLPVIQWGGWIVITIILAKLFWLISLHFIMPDVSAQKVSVSKGKRASSSLSKGIDVNNRSNILHYKSVTSKIPPHFNQAV